MSGLEFLYGEFLAALESYRAVISRVEKKKAELFVCAKSIAVLERILVQNGVDLLHMKQEVEGR